MLVSFFGLSIKVTLHVRIFYCTGTYNGTDKACNCDLKTKVLCFNSCTAYGDSKNITYPRFIIITRNMLAWDNKAEGTYRNGLSWLDLKHNCCLKLISVENWRDTNKFMASKRHCTTYTLSPLFYFLFIQFFTFGYLALAFADSLRQKYWTVEKYCTFSISTNKNMCQTHNRCLLSLSHFNISTLG